MARVCAAESNSLASRRNWVRHSVTLTVNKMYTPNAVKVIHANHGSNFTARMVKTITTSMSVGTML